MTNQQPTLLDNLGTLGLPMDMACAVAPHKLGRVALQTNSAESLWLHKHGML